MAKAAISRLPEELGPVGSIKLSRQLTWSRSHVQNIKLRYISHFVCLSLFKDVLISARMLCMMLPNNSDIALRREVKKNWHVNYKVFT